MMTLPGAKPGRIDEPFDAQVAVVGFVSDFAYLSWKVVERVDIEGIVQGSGTKHAIAEWIVDGEESACSCGNIAGECEKDIEGGEGVIGGAAEEATFGSRSEGEFIFLELSVGEGEREDEEIEGDGMEERTGGGFRHVSYPEAFSAVDGFLRFGDMG